MKKALALFAIASLIAAHSQGQKARKVFSAADSIVASPLVAGKLIIVNSIDSTCYALCADGFSIQWSYKADVPLRSQAAHAGGKIYLETGNSITCLDLTTGSFLWKYPEESPAVIKKDQWDFLRPSPLPYQGRIYCTDDYGNVYAADSAGNKAFSYNIGAEVPIRSGASVHRGLLMFGCWNGFIYLYSLAGDTIYLALNTVPKKSYPGHGAVTSPIVANNELITWGARSGMLQVYDLNAKMLRWQFPSPGETWLAAKPVFSKNELFFSSTDGRTIYCFVAASGFMKWSRELNQNIFAPPLITKKSIIAADGNAYDKGYGIIYYLSPINGGIGHSIAVEGNIFSQPAAYKKTILVSTDKGKLYSISRK
jgi:outer membrane protein assembly factor BamB